MAETPAEENNKRLILGSRFCAKFGFSFLFLRRLGMTAAARMCLAAQPELLLKGPVPLTATEF